MIVAGDGARHTVPVRTDADDHTKVAVRRMDFKRRVRERDASRIVWGRHRGVQIEKLRRRIERLVPPKAPLIVAGDFNDWRFRVTHQLAHPLNLHEVFERLTNLAAGA